MAHSNILLIFFRMGEKAQNIIVNKNKTYYEILKSCETIT